ncbi:hypothetical protein CHS0354_003343 [Potamilus streckersoni]|uniref:Homeobox domain-containing protein n=1 Tax=Potamilus streckersoni TaxID=2493646 RepID=A0AAE0VPJ3_9BIVA|nr:hypothetical protein CHS0354_003343 [Potamilus streckersoni]
MTATRVAPCSRRSKGFTIDSIIGKESEPSASPISQTSIQDGENVSEYRVIGSETNSYGIVNSGLNGRNARDMCNVSDPTLFHGSATDVMGTTVPSNILKYFHGAFVPTSVPFVSPDLCRYPLPSLNVSGVYSQHIEAVSSIQPMLYNDARDFRETHPYFASRFPGNLLSRFGVPGTSGLFFHPYRKPKRIRTAFSPSQLLMLEQAFEKSHYVVGQERKDLAAELQLSETQVKVWFQNRRTKHKRIKTDDKSVICSQGESPVKDSDDNQSNNSDEESDISDNDDDVIEARDYDTTHYHAVQT